MEDANFTVVFVGFADGRPHDVITRSANGRLEYFDFDWCERDQLLYWNDVGSGPASPRRIYEGEHFWAAPDMELGDEAKGVRLAQMPNGYRLDKLFDPALCGDTEWCPICDDNFPSENTYQICDHVWWCDESGDWSKPNERCPADCRECIDRDRERKASPMIDLAIGYGRAQENNWH